MRYLLLLDRNNSPPPLSDTDLLDGWLSVSRASRWHEISICLYYVCRERSAQKYKDVHEFRNLSNSLLKAVLALSIRICSVWSAFLAYIICTRGGWWGYIVDENISIGRRKVPCGKIIDFNSFCYLRNLVPLRPTINQPSVKWEKRNTLSRWSLTKVHLWLIVNNTSWLVGLLHKIKKSALNFTL